MAQRAHGIRPWALGAGLWGLTALAAGSPATGVPGAKTLSEQLSKALPLLAPSLRSGKILGMARREGDDQGQLVVLACEPKPEAARPCQLWHFDILPLRRSAGEPRAEDSAESQSVAGAASIVAWPLAPALETALPEALARLWCLGLSINQESPVIEGDAVSRTLRQLGRQHCPAALSSAQAGPAMALASAMQARLSQGCLLLPRLEQPIAATPAANGEYLGKAQVPGQVSWHWRENKAGKLTALWTEIVAGGDTPRDAFAAQGFARESRADGGTQHWMVATESQLGACASYSLVLPHRDDAASPNENMELWARLASEPQQLAAELAPLASKPAAEPLLRLIHVLALDRADRPEALAAYAALLQIPQAPSIAGMPWAALVRLSRAALLLEQGLPQEALVDAEFAFRAMPWNRAAAYWLGAAYKLSGQAALAARPWQLAVALVAAERQLEDWLVGYRLQRGASVHALLEPEPSKVYNDLAWLLATSREASVRQGSQAVRLAERAIELAAEDSAALFDTLAAAHAAAGSFEVAISTSKKAIELASEADRVPLQKHLAAFQRHEIWVE